MFLLKQLIRMLYVQMTLKECNQLATGKDLVCKKEENKNNNLKAVQKCLTLIILQKKIQN